MAGAGARKTEKKNESLYCQRSSPTYFLLPTAARLLPTALLTTRGAPCGNRGQRNLRPTILGAAAYGRVLRHRV